MQCIVINLEVPLETAFTVRPMELIQCLFTVIYLLSTLQQFRICHEGIERKMNDKLNKVKGTFSVLIGGDYSGICVERESVHQYSSFPKVSINIACFRKCPSIQPVSESIDQYSLFPKVSINIACFLNPRLKLGLTSTRNNNANPWFLNFTKLKLNNVKFVVQIQQIKSSFEIYSGVLEKKYMDMAHRYKVVQI